MIRTTIHPAFATGVITAPPSKSVMQRACMAALLRRGITILHNTGASNDGIVLMELLAKAGCITEIIGEKGLLIDARKSDLSFIKSIDFGSSGLALRMCAPLLCLSDHEVAITGSEQLQKRPMRFFEEVLPQLGVSVASENGSLPIILAGPLQPKDIVVDGSISSQFVTGLIMAYSAAGARDKTIVCQNLVSTPYLDLTLEVLSAFGLKAPVWKGGGQYHFDGQEIPGSTASLHYTIEGDWSAAAFLLVAGAIAGEVVVTGLDGFSAQGDKAILQALMDAGAPVSITAASIIARAGPLKAFHFNAMDMPDLFPPLAVLAAYATGTSVVEGVHRLRGKESDRAATICDVLGRMGASIRLQDNLMIIDGGRSLTGAVVSSFGDHRIAMMAAVAALGATGETTITGSECVAKSYPHFFDDLQRLGISAAHEAG